MKKQEILQKIFESRWNSTDRRPDKKIISLFYRKGGFDGLYNFIIQEKERMSKNSNYMFESYYSEDLEETMYTAKESLIDEDFENFIFNYPLINFHKGNFKKMKEFDMLQYYSDFNTDFRGEVKRVHQVNDYKIIETLSRDKEPSFYVVGDFTTCYHSVEIALMAAIFKGKHMSTFYVLLKDIENDK